MNYKYLITNDTNPYKNLAREQYLFQFAEDNLGIIYLWQNQNTIVIGKNQNVYSECRVAEFIESGGRIARRRSGGGAVFHDLGNLNFSIITKNEDYEKARYQDIVIETLHMFRIEAEFNGRNDLIIDNRKFSGNAFYDNGDVYCQHGTILIDVDIAKMEYYLTPDESKLERNHVSSVSTRVFNLREINKDISIKSIQQAMIFVTGAKELEIVIKDEDMENELKYFENKNWIYGGVG